jgi:hypothetical protein
VPDLGTSAPFKLRVIRETFAAASNWPTMSTRPALFT